MPKLLTELTIKVQIIENIETDEELRNSVDCGDIEARHFLTLRDAIYQIGGVYEAELTGAKVFMDSESGIFLRACPCCGKFETLINDWCDPESCPDADCDLCEEAAVRIRCDEEQGGCGYRSPMWHTTVEEAEVYWNGVADSLDAIDERSWMK